jgi:DNA modification methylase
MSIIVSGSPMSAKPNAASNELFPPPPMPKIKGFKPAYTTKRGAAYLADALDVLRGLPDSSVNAVITSPPYALHFKKAYGNATKADYIGWFLPFAQEIKRVLTDDGSLVLNIGGSYNKGTPTRSLYHFKLLIALVEEVGLHLAQECFWFNPAKMPTPAEWVNVRRMRVKDSVEYIFWLSKTPWPKANNRNVLRAYSKDMERLVRKGLSSTTRPSGHAINASFASDNAGGSIPANLIDDHVPLDLLRFGNNSANDLYTKRCKEAGIKIHPARFPAALPEFFMKLTTEPGDLIVDPFAGSNTTGFVAEALGRRWIAIDDVAEYVRASAFRFEDIPKLTPSL